MSRPLYLYVADEWVAMIALPPKCADAYVPEEPWCLLHNSGRVDRFVSLKAAREEAVKSYGPKLEFKKS